MTGFTRRLKARRHHEREADCDHFRQAVVGEKFAVAFIDRTSYAATCRICYESKLPSTGQRTVCQTYLDGCCSHEKKSGERLWGRGWNQRLEFATQNPSNFAMNFYNRRTHG